ncbi:MAG: transposase domain-containing protein [Leptospiraceae bacterium]|nr:transposase domain-containing protein [Leptospiraceae bacterium]
MISGSPRGADPSALIYSLIETAKVNKLEPWVYLRYLFEKQPLCQSDEEMRALLPHRVDPAGLHG